MVDCASAPGGQQGGRLLLGEVRGVFGSLGQAEGCHLGRWWTGAVSAAGLVQAVPGLDIPWVISSCAMVEGDWALAGWFAGLMGNGLERQGIEGIVRAE